MRARWAPLPVLLVLACLPALSLIGHPGAFLAGPYSELPVRLWIFDRFSGARVMGAFIDHLAYPNVGLLNNPDPLGTIFMSLMAPPLGVATAFNLMVEVSS